VGRGGGKSASRWQCVGNAHSGSGAHSDAYQDTDTDVEQLARIGELPRLRGLAIASHEEQLERMDGRLRALYLPDF